MTHAQEPLYLSALKGRRTSRPPVWLMRQAGRYLPEYQALRAKYSFMEMMHTPELAAEVTLQPIRRFGFDAAILFSDILIVADALGSKLHFEEGHGPVIDNPVRSADDVHHLPAVDLEVLSTSLLTIKHLLPHLSVPLIGFAGAPFTVASYMVEGGSGDDFHRTKHFFFAEPEAAQKLLAAVTQATVTYVQAQVAAGVQAIQIFDSWLNVLSPSDRQRFALPYLTEVVQSVVSQVPVTVFSRGSGQLAQELVTTGATAISLDWTCGFSQIRAQLGPKMVLQGNLDPAYLETDIPALDAAVTALLDDMAPFQGTIFNLGHGITPRAKIDLVYRLVENIYAYSGKADRKT